MWQQRGREPPSPWAKCIQPEPQSYSIPTDCFTQGAFFTRFSSVRWLTFDGFSVSNKVRLGWPELRLKLIRNPQTVCSNGIQKTWLTHELLVYMELMNM